MKIRSGFVSNSSSSSFIVSFKKVPENKNELRNLLFDKDQTMYQEFPIDKVIDTIWHNMENQKPNNKEQIIECINGGYIVNDISFYKNKTSRLL